MNSKKSNRKMGLICCFGTVLAVALLLAPQLFMPARQSQHSKHPETLTEFTDAAKQIVGERPTESYETVFDEADKDGDGVLSWATKTNEKGTGKQFAVASRPMHDLAYRAVKSILFIQALS